jgi:hypothetical protein
MSSLSRKLKKYFKDEKPTQMEEILTYLCRMNRRRISDTITSSESMYVVETSVIKSIQTHMAKNGHSMYKTYMIQMILVKQSPLYPDKCIIRVDHDEWLNVGPRRPTRCSASRSPFGARASLPTTPYLGYSEHSRESCIVAYFLSLCCCCYHFIGTHGTSSSTRQRRIY